jgi:hypothetical protein
MNEGDPDRGVARACTLNRAITPTKSSERVKTTKFGFHPPPRVFTAGLLLNFFLFQAQP